MVTDIEMSAMEGLRALCEDKISKDILDVAQEMLGALDADGFKTEEEGTEFLKQYAEEVDSIVLDAVQNETVRKRMIGDYEVLCSFVYGDKEVFMAESDKVPEAERYVVGYCVSNDLFVRYEDVMGSNDYNEMAELYSQRIQQQIQKVKENLARFPYDRTVIGRESCDSIQDRNIEGEIIVIDPNVIKREYVGADRQLWLAQSGFGCSPEGSGRKVYAKNLFTGETAQWYRQDVLGTIKPECIPDWVKDRMTDMPVEVLFTFGSSQQFPFQMGYVSITAPSVPMAIDVFRCNYPDHNEGLLNCCDYYYKEESVASIKEHGNGAGCHKSINITIPATTGKTVESILQDAQNRVGETTLDEHSKENDLEDI